MKDVAIFELLYISLGIEWVTAKRNLCSKFRGVSIVHFLQQTKVLSGNHIFANQHATIDIAVKLANRPLC